jgi:hypothetical protein
MKICLRVLRVCANPLNRRDSYEGDNVRNQAPCNGQESTRLLLSSLCPVPEVLMIGSLTEGTDGGVRDARGVGTIDLDGMS